MFASRACLDFCKYIVFLHVHFMEYIMGLLLNDFVLCKDDVMHLLGIVNVASIA